MQKTEYCMTEIWKDIKDFEGLYQVSTWGRVKSLNYRRTKKEGIMKLCDNGHGYYHITLSKNGVSHDKRIHCLVAEAFLPNPENKPCIDHIDGNPMNNNVSNLRRCTYKENSNNPITLKRYSEARKGEKHYLFNKHVSEESKIKNRNSHILKPVVCIKDGIIIKRYEALNDVKKDGFSAGNVCSCCNDTFKSYKGYNWMYLSDYEKMFGQLN